MGHDESAIHLPSIISIECLFSSKAKTVKYVPSKRQSAIFESQTDFANLNLSNFYNLQTFQRIDCRNEEKQNSFMYIQGHTAWEPSLHVENIHTFLVKRPGHRRDTI